MKAKLQCILRCSITRMCIRTKALLYLTAESRNNGKTSMLLWWSGVLVVYLISVYFYCSRRKPAISDRTKPQQFVFICKQFCFSLAEIYKHPHTWSLACKGENVSYWQKHSTSLLVLFSEKLFKHHLKLLFPEEQGINITMKDWFMCWLCLGLIGD